jgi:hypothetical protein
LFAKLSFEVRPTTNNWPPEINGGNATAGLKRSNQNSFFAKFRNWRRDKLALVLRIEDFGIIANGIANYRTLIEGGQFGRARG